MLTIGVGIGANAAVSGFIRGSITSSLPLADAGTVVSLFARNSEGQLGPISYDRYVSLKERHDALRLLGGVREFQTSIVIGERMTMASVASITSEVAELFGLPVADGIVISDRLRRLEFSGTAAVRGQRIRMAGTETLVAGVAPEWLEGLYVGRVIDIWVPLQAAVSEGFNRGSRTFWAVGRLPSTVSRDRAEADANAVRTEDDEIVVLPYTGMTPDVSGGMTLIRRLLRGSAAAVFLIACANVAGFFLSRTSARTHERSVRIALGASRAYLRLQLLSESILVSLTGGAFAVFLAFLAARIIPALLVEQDAERLAFAPDLIGIVATSVLCAGITVICGLVPLLEMRRDNPAPVLQRESAGPSRTLRRVRAALVVTQMTVCCVLVISTAVLVESFRSALRTTTGHRLGEPILATVAAASGWERPDLGLAYFREAERRVHAIPGIAGTAWTATLPGSRPTWYDFRVEVPHLPVREVALDVVTFTPETAARISAPLAGRMFGFADRPGSCRVAIVNQAAAERLFRGAAVGRSIEDAAGTRVEIIGVVATRAAPDEVPRERPTIYYYAEQIGTTSDRQEPIIFRVPRLANTATAVLAGNIVSSGYLNAVGMSVMAGGVFTASSASPGCRVGVVNREAADLYFAGDAVGGAVIDGSGNRTEIVGVVHSSVLRTSQRRDEPAIYFPLGQDYRPLMTLFLSAPDAPAALVADVRRQLDTVPGGIPRVVTTLTEHLSRTALASERIAAVLVGACAVTALTLAILGLYGALADAVRHRRRDIALRLALGAHGWRVSWQLMREGLWLASVGTMAGIIGALAVTRWMAVNSRVTGHVEPWVWLAAPGVLFAAVVIASLVPMRRATAVNPVSLLQRK